MHATVDLAPIESRSPSTPTPSGKPQIRLVKIDGKLTAVPIHEDKPVQVHERVQVHEPIHSIKPVQAVEPLKAVEPALTDQSGILSYGPGVTLQNLLQQAIEKNASDLHVHSGAVLRMRVGGKFCDATPDVLSSRECEKLIFDLLNESQLNQLKEKFQVDFAYEMQGVGRFRANVYKQQRGYDAVFRAIKPKPPTLADLGLPKEFEKYTQFHQGLVLFTGPAGCGKSSTMAAMVDLVNKRRPDHILTIEDPIEYVHDSDSCNVTQREVGAQTESFPTALRAALREDPDVIVIGELRDLETISLAITAAETGHLVMATLHTSNVIRTINRLLGVFPPDQICQIRRMLSESLKVVISQRLVRRADDRGQVAALEVMINNNAVANLIRENRTYQIKSILQTGRAQGQRLLDASLTQLVKDKVITKTEAIKYAEEPENFQ
jgi:twitching motility protein PilT